MVLESLSQDHLTTSTIIRLCHAELELRNKNGEQGLRIVYASGVPKVSSTQPKNGSTRV